MAAHCTRFSNTDCEFFPCHGIENQNCLFCYCPLYLFDCGGVWSLINGVKDCSACAIVHAEGGYEFVQEGLRKFCFASRLPGGERGHEQ